MINNPMVVEKIQKLKRRPVTDFILLSASILFQLVLGTLLGHAYDMRINMATGYLVGTGQNPYIAQDLSSVFSDPSFQNITTLGYPPPWALVLGLIYLVSYYFFPNLVIYNLAIKIPIIIANICLAYTVRKLLTNIRVKEEISRKAWKFLLFNPFLLIVTTAWGQFDSIVAVFSLLSIYMISGKKYITSALLLALAISFKPTALALIPAVFIFIRKEPIRLVFQYFAILLIGAFFLFVGPFVILRWDPGPILQHWNAHFVVGGGMSFMTFLEITRDSYQIPGLWWLVGLLWVPALGIAALVIKPGRCDLADLLKKSTAFVLIFFLFRTWVSEPNIVLLLPMIVVLSSIGEVPTIALTAIWIGPLIFSLFNTSLTQLLFPISPAFMERILQLDVFHGTRLVIRSIVVVIWLVAEGWIISQCLRNIQVQTKYSY